MAKAEAYSETHKRNISLDEAHQLYITQLGKKKRFVFKCGDSQCRAMLDPLVVGVLYDREDKPGGKPYTPYFRYHDLHPHIKSCTWMEGFKKSSNTSSTHTGSSSTGWAVSTSGLIFNSAPHIQNPNGGIIEPRGPNNSSGGERPETSRFMNVVATRYLHYTKSQREGIRLDIDKQCSGSFYSICRPLYTFHPHYQPQHIYFGYVNIVELDHVFLVQFIKKMAPDGLKENRNSIAQIKLLKARLINEELTLLELLEGLVKNPEPAICFFYSNNLPSTKNINTAPFARFEVARISNISIIPVSKINADTSEL